jgi:valyl-tRNA synthetase
MKVGRRLALKLLNASKFALSFPEPPADAAITEPIDRSLLARLADLVDDATAAFEGYDYARALERTEALFWTFCDDYVELVKERAYAGDERSASATATLQLALSTLARMFAPFLPFACEEVWSWWQDGSVHRAAWPAAAELRAAAADGDSGVLGVVGAVLGEVRKAKSTAKVSMRTEAKRVVVSDTEPRIAAIRDAERDLRNAGVIGDLVLEVGEPAVDVTLAL